MTGYRDETEALRKRVTELEGELTGAQAEIAKLRGEAPAVRVAERTDPLVGEPLHFVAERELAFSISERGYEAIAALVRDRLPGAQVAQVGRTLTGPGLSLSTGPGWTRLRLETDLRASRAAVLSGPVLAGLFGGLPTLGLILDLSQHAAVSPWHAAWAIPAILAGGGLGMRALVARGARMGRARHEGLLAAIESLAHEHRVPEEPSARVRVALDESASETEDVAGEEGGASAAAASESSRA